MDRTITKIERQRRHPFRFNLYINGKYAMSVHEDVVIKCRLAKGQKLKEKEWTRLLIEEEHNQAKQAALNYVNYKPRTKTEVTRHLEHKGFASKPISSALIWLETYGYIDDRAFAEAWIEERSRSKGKGRQALYHELKQKGIDEERIREALDAFTDEDERELAREWAYKRYERVKHLPWVQVERRVGSFLQRRGFPFALILDVLQELRAVHSESEA